MNQNSKMGIKKYQNLYININLQMIVKLGQLKEFKVMMNIFKNHQMILQFITKFIKWKAENKKKQTVKVKKVILKKQKVFTLIKIIKINKKMKVN